jgi:protein-S-isoprenylcysteine O-methyltransferase Ste14
MGIGFSITIFRIIIKEDDLLGNPSINPFLYYSGKISLFLCVGFSLFKAIFPTFGCVNVPMWMSWIGACSLCVSTGVLLLSFYGLGSSLKYGLPEKETQLITSGLYRFSRNPMYLGVFMVTLSCLIFFPNVLNIIIGLYCISMHYLMALGEEKFLTERFGSEWEEYKKKVRRFL